MAQLENGKRWYLMDLDNYTPEFLAEIVIELNENIERLRIEKQYNKCSKCGEITKHVIGELR